MNDFQKPSGTPAKKSRTRTPKWVRRPGRLISENRFFAWLMAKLATGYLNLVFKTNSWQVEPEDSLEIVKRDLPVIAAVWHGKTLLFPVIPIGLKASVMISRSLDGEITTRVVKAFGNKAIRASGGRDAKHTFTKGALKGFFDMLSALENGENVFQTADIPKGTRRRAGPGIIALAQRSGRPILPIAVASSKRWVLPKSWDLFTINRPFGKSAIVVGKPIWVDALANEKSLEEHRLEVQRELDRITKRAYALTGKPE